MKKKKVVMHFVSGLLSGGVEQMLYNYCRFMDKEQFEFVVVYQHEAVRDCLDKIQSIPCKVIRITARNENFLKNILDAYKVIKEYKPNIVHAHMNLMNFCALFPAKILKVKVRISHSHTSEKNKSKIYTFAADIFKLLNIWSASSLLACGEEAGEYMYGKKRMRDGKVEIIENAVDLDHFERNQMARKCIREKIGCKENDILLGHIGRFTEQKNHKRLLEIFVEVKKYRPDSKLILVGTGELFDGCNQYAEKLCISDSVIFWGTTKDVNSIYSAIDVFVLPSLYEGLPVVAIEVQAARVPAVLSDTIAPSCKLTELIKFVSLKESNSTWANEIILSAGEDRNVDLSKLYASYDVKSKAKKIEHYYLYTLQNLDKTN